MLFLVRDGKVALIVQVSTGATGNTPLGHWRVYSKVPGFNAKAMYFSSFFVGAFAIHGYHSVPPYPASHGCVRMPLWVATAHLLADRLRHERLHLLVEPPRWRWWRSPRPAGSSTRSGGAGAARTTSPGAT